MSIYDRVSVVGDGDEFRAEDPTRGFQGGNEFSIVALVWMLDASFSATDEPFVVLAGGANEGYLFSAGAGGNTVFGSIGTGAALVFPESRTFVAGDIGKAHRLVLVSSVSAGFARIYTNGLDDGTPAALAAYAPPTPATGYEVLSNPLALGLQSMELLDMAILDRALSADDVSDLDVEIMAHGRIPSAWASWVDLYRPERLVGHPHVWDRGGQNAGRGMVCRTGPAASTLGTPTLRSRRITAWGGF